MIPTGNLTSTAAFPWRYDLETRFALVAFCTGTSLHLSRASKAELFSKPLIKPLIWDAQRLCDVTLVSRAALCIPSKPWCAGSQGQNNAVSYWLVANLEPALKWSITSKLQGDFNQDATHFLCQETVPEYVVFKLQPFCSYIHVLMKCGAISSRAIVSRGYWAFPHLIATQAPANTIHSNILLTRNTTYGYIIMTRRSNMFCAVIT